MSRRDARALVIVDRARTERWRPGMHARCGERAESWSVGLVADLEVELQNSLPRLAALILATSEKSERSPVSVARRIAAAGRDAELDYQAPLRLTFDGADADRVCRLN